MNPWIAAFMTVGPAMFLLGFLVRPLLAAGTSSPPPVNPPTKEEITMAVYAELVQPLADLNAAIAALPANVSAAVAKGDPAAAQDKTDTLTAVESTLSAATLAINGVGQ